MQKNIVGWNPLEEHVTESREEHMSNNIEHVLESKEEHMSINIYNACQKTHKEFVSEKREKHVSEDIKERI